MNNEIIKNVAYDNYDDFQHVNFNYEKNGYFATSLVTQIFWVVKDICNLLYLYIMSANGQVAWVATQRMYNAIHCNSIKTIHFQLLCNSIITTPMMSCWHH